MSLYCIFFVVCAKPIYVVCHLNNHLSSYQNRHNSHFQVTFVRFVNQQSIFLHQPNQRSYFCQYKHLARSFKENFPKIDWQKIFFKPPVEGSATSKFQEQLRKRTCLQVERRGQNALTGSPCYSYGKWSTRFLSVKMTIDCVVSMIKRM